jgi:ATP-dependent DNA helicase RecQ
MDLIDELGYRPIISAFTATATKQVREDIIRILEMNNPEVVTTGFDRKNLKFEVHKPVKFLCPGFVVDRAAFKQGFH